MATGPALQDVEKKNRQQRKINVVHTTVELLIQFAGWTQQTASLARLMLMSILNKIKLRARDLTGCVNKRISAFLCLIRAGRRNFMYTDIPAWDSFFGICAVVEDYLFYRPIREVPLVFC